MSVGVVGETSTRNEKVNQYLECLRGESLGPHKIEINFQSDSIAISSSPSARAK